MTNKEFYLYSHTTPSNKVYIGITSNIPEKRWKNGNGYKGYNSILYKAILKYGWDNIEHRIIARLSEESAKELEKAFISFYKRYDRSLNITDGGEGLLGFKHSEETKQKMSDKAIGKKLSKESIIKRTNSWKSNPNNKINSLKTLEIAREVWKGQKHSESTKENMRQYAKLTGRAPSKECLGKRLLTSRIPINQIDSVGNIIDTYYSIQNAADVLNLKACSISQVVSGRRNSLFGLYFKKKELC